MCYKVHSSSREAATGQLWEACAGTTTSLRILGGLFTCAFERYVVECGGLHQVRQQISKRWPYGVTPERVSGTYTVSRCEQAQLGGPY